MPDGLVITLKSIISLTTIVELKMIYDNVLAAKKTNMIKPSMVVMYTVMTLALITNLLFVWLDNNLFKSNPDFLLFTAEDELAILTKFFLLVFV